MKNYIITFRDIKTNEEITKVCVNYDEEIVEKIPNILCLAALEELTIQKQPLPKRNKSSWSWKQI